MIMLYGFCGLFIYLFTRNNISAHVFVNSVVMIITVMSLFMLNKYPPPIYMLVNGLFVCYLCDIFGSHESVRVNGC